MTPEEQERLKACAAEIADIFYKNTPLTALENLETIEQHLRQQWLDIIGPQIGFFLSNRQPEQKWDGPEP